MDKFYQFLNNLGYDHPLHPTMVYLPIGCIMAALIFGVIGALFNRNSLVTTARHCCSLALAGVLPTVLLGYMDWQHYFSGILFFPIKVKMILAGVLLVLLAVTVAYCRNSAAGRIKILVLYALCFINVVVIGYYGGEIVFAGFKPINKVENNVAVKAPQEHAGPLTYADIEDIFRQHCYECHSDPDAPFNLRLDSYAHLMAGDVDGKVVVPGKPAESELIRRIRGISTPAMPFMRPALPEGSIERISNWIEQGARQ